MATKYPGIEHIRRSAPAETAYLLRLLDDAYAELVDKRREVDQLVEDGREAREESHTPEPMRVGRIALKYAVLPRLLGFPQGMRILAQHIDPFRNQVVLFVESDDLPICEEYAIPPELSVMVRLKDIDGERWYQAGIQMPEEVQRLKAAEQQDVPPANE